MILEALVGVSLIANVSTQAGIEPGGNPSPIVMSAQQKVAIMRPLVRAATECVQRAVTADPKFSAQPDADIRELIIASMPGCADSMRAMIDAHDQLYGEGSGEQFFMGPYLDTLPTSVIKAVKGPSQ